MDITVYLPDELGAWAKESGLNLSRMLREAVRREQDLAESRKARQGEMATHKLMVDVDGDYVNVRLRAKELAWDGGNQWLYATPDGHIFVFNGDAMKLYGADDDGDPQPAVEYAGSEDLFLEWFRFGNPSFYLAVMKALGKEAVIDIGGC